MAAATFTVSRLTNSLGAAVDGVRLGSLTDAEFAAVRDALVEHKVLFFRDQHLTEAEHRALVTRWAEPMVFPVSRLLGRDDPMGKVIDTPDSPPDADNWHTDITWWPEPPSVAVLCALTIPESGGDTMWLDLERIYDALSPSMRRLCEQLTVHHAPGERFIAANRRIMGDEVGDLIAAQCTGAHHPLVRTHPVSGRPSLFLSSFIRRIDGMTQAESDEFLAPLRRRLDDPNVQVRWHWRAGDVAIWDEASTNHRALSDHYPQYREMRRCTASGERPWFSSDGTRANATIVTRSEREVVAGADSR
jgi:taurine dioxygenase